MNRIITIILIGSTLWTSCSKNPKNKERVNTTYKQFENQFSLVEYDTVEIDTSFILNLTQKSVLDKNLVAKYLGSDSVISFEIKENDSSFSVLRTITNDFRLNFSKNNFSGFMYSFILGENKYNYYVHRLGLFKDLKFFKGNYVALMAWDTDIKRNLNYIITARIVDSLIYQYKIALTLHDEPNLQGRMGGEEDYYFTIKDTLETSTLIIINDGTLKGKNLADVGL